ncbi:ABC transporter permease [Micromonospora sp. DR5-3]|uniref:ABC transporter permease n=1 Tax=unclassified Micromonospora TaxID=2617518 RepID=UPI0011DB93D3|nr:MULTISPECIES: ABC transporter permease [unclassified Micromonospora]MCW3816826.1 ABC transporter permease [Micromonospora sp. DR5-3]TYC23727.1 ABC transporter permease [Micromonospora sp. MP36]
MLSLAVRTLVTRWVTLVSTFIALAVGVGLVGATGQVIGGTLTAPPRPAQRYAAAPAVVSPVDELRVTTVNGPAARPLAEPRGLPAELVARLGALGPVVVDRTFYAQLPDGGADQVGHPWSAAAVTPYRMLAGRPPAAAGEIVVAERAAAVGDRVTVLSGAGARAYTVVGVTAAVPFERAVFFTDAEAARISPRIDALVVSAPAPRVRQAIGADAVLHTGSGLRRLDPDLRRDAEALTAANALAGTAGGVAVFVSIFVVAGTFAYALAQRRRELALLRMAGATPGQVRRLIFAEATVVALLASAAGWQLARLGGPRLAGWLVELGLAPPWFTASQSPTPLVIAFTLGMTAALVGVCSSAWRAGRIRPVEAIRQAAVESAAMSVGRWIGGLGVLVGALAMLLWPLLDTPADALKRKQYIPMIMLLVVAFALLAPVLVPRVARLLAGPLANRGGVTGTVVGQTVLTAARRTAATAAPVLLTVGLAAGLLSATATVDQARAVERRAQLAGDYLVLPAGTPGLNREVVDRVRQIPGLRTRVVYPTSVYDVEDGEALIRHGAHATTGDAPLDLLALPVLDGSLDDLRDDTIVVDQEWGRRVGEPVRIWLGDGTPVSLRVAAVIRDGAGGNGAYLTGRYAGAALAERIQVQLPTDVDRAATERALRAAIAGLGATLTTPDQWSNATAAHRNRASAIGLRVVLGIALLYAILAITGTMLMAARDRARDLTLLRLAGATARQILRIVATEALLVVALGVTLAGGVTGLTLGGLWVALLQLVGPAAVVLPGQPVAGMVAAAALVALLSSVLPAALGLTALGRRRPGPRRPAPARGRRFTPPGGRRR